MKQQQIDDAQAQYAAMQSQQQNVQNKIDYYNSLIRDDLTDWETLEQDLRVTAGALKTAEASLHLLGGILYLLPDVGSPFAMKYGGTELGDSQETFAAWYASMASWA